MMRFIFDALHFRQDELRWPRAFAMLNLYILASLCKNFNHRLNIFFGFGLLKVGTIIVKQVLFFQRYFILASKKA